MAYAEASKRPPLAAAEVVGFSSESFRDVGDVVRCSLLPVYYCGTVSHDQFAMVSFQYPLGWSALVSQHVVFSP